MDSKRTFRTLRPRLVVDEGQCPALAVDPEEIWGRSGRTSGLRWPQLPADALQAGDPINGQHGLLQPPLRAAFIQGSARLRRWRFRQDFKVGGQEAQAAA